MPLRRRFALLATLLGFLLSTLAATIIVFVADDYEYIIATEILRGQAEDYGLRLANRLPVELPRTQRLSGYRIDSPELPRTYATFPLGVHEDGNNENIHVGVFDTAAGRLVFTIDLGDIETLERHLQLFVVAIILLGTGFAGWIGWLFSGLALEPVRTLAEGVEALPAEPRPTRLADEVSHDELGRLASAIDAYQARLVEADAREQAFFADASHELRTPLAVVQGVSDILLDDPPSNPADLSRLQRLERGIRDMRHLLEAMLEAARRRPLQAERTGIAALLSDAADAALSGKPGVRPVVVASGEMPLPRREVLLLVAGLARKLVQPLATGELQLRAEADRIVIRAASDAPAQTTVEGDVRADTGTGSALLDRLAVRLGWRVVFDTPAQVSILFAATP